MINREAFREGVRRLNRAKRVWWVFYAATTAPALLISAVLMSVAYSSLGHSLWAERMADNLDVSWLAELATKDEGIGVAIGALIAGTAVLCTIVYILLLGGAIEVLCADGVFAFGCGTHFFPLMRLSLFALLMCVGPVLINHGLAAIGDGVWGAGLVRAPLIYWSWFRAAVLFCLLGGVNAAFEHAAIRLVVERRRDAVRALTAALAAIIRRPIGMLAPYAILVILLLLVAAVGLSASRMIPGTAISAVAVTFLLQQVAVLGKIWAWLACYPVLAAAWDLLPTGRPSGICETALGCVPEKLVKEEAEIGLADPNSRSFS